MLITLRLDQESRINHFQIPLTYNGRDELLQQRKSREYVKVGFDRMADRTTLVKNSNNKGYYKYIRIFPVLTKHTRP